MNDDNKTNEELLEEVKKLRKIVEDKLPDDSIEDDFPPDSTLEKWIIKWLPILIVSGIIVFILFLLLGAWVT